jgi:glutathione S-transferase
MIRLYDYLPSQNCYKVRLLMSHLDQPYETELALRLVASAPAGRRRGT